MKKFFRCEEGELPCFDLLLLGMGGDGHTASLFAGSSLLREETKIVASENIKKLDSTRVTFTSPLIRNAANIIFIVTGANKAAALKAVLEGAPEPVLFPASLARHAEGRVRWFVDKEAASMLSDIH